MAKLEQYRETVQKLLQNYAAFGRGDRTVETELIFDTTRNRYQNLRWMRSLNCLEQEFVGPDGFNKIAIFNY